VLFGVDDDRSIIGVGSEKEEMEMIQTAASVYCDPPIEPIIDTVPYKGRDVVCRYGGRKRSRNRIISMLMMREE